MITLNEIRNDLKDIRYYYARKKMFDEAFASIVENEIIIKVKRYNDAVMSASPRLYDLYISLYVKNHTQESLSNELCYTPEYIQMLNKKLLKFLQSKLSEQGEN